MKTLIPTNLGPLPHLECLKCGPMGTKRGPKYAKNEIYIFCYNLRTGYFSYLGLQMTKMGLSGCLHWSSNLIPPLPTQNRPTGPICEAKRPKFVGLFRPLFGPRRAPFGTFWVWKMAQSGLSGCLHWCSNLVPPFPNQNGPSWAICVAKRLFLAYFGSFLVPVGPNSGHSGCGKLVCMDVFIGVPTLFCPFQPNIFPMS